MFRSFFAIVILTSLLRRRRRAAGHRGACRSATVGRPAADVLAWRSPGSARTSPIGLPEIPPRRATAAPVPVALVETGGAVARDGWHGAAFAPRTGATPPGSDRAPDGGIGLNP
ncbi:MAG: hypothetical protein AVDCRST_MAG49-2585 [uncultured Thermomicrobiales bacterium]|uniref:Uncharacterized protein n=1 Tax=uncultured Thermomicrobiales bacterium TaxID=1645740 RepID=A0A6J4UXM1_9BACT|nr:MAG: hypothetical protein AVDCRST_MAG49-2585 [uncultured Thermomicrobiales bacterium]